MLLWTFLMFPRIPKKIGSLRNTVHRILQWDQWFFGLGAGSRSLLICFLPNFFILLGTGTVGVILATSEGAWTGIESKRSHFALIVHFAL